MKQSTQTRHIKSLAWEVDRLSTLSMAAGKDFNDELTLILNHADVSLGLLGTEHPATSGLIEVTKAVLRCAETARCLMRLTLRTRQLVRYPKGRRANSGH